VRERDCEAERKIDKHTNIQTDRRGKKQKDREKEKLWTDRDKLEEAKGEREGKRQREKQR